MQIDKVGVIVPVYNIERYVGHCVQTLIDQTYEDLEIILVDDGSTDSSGEICDAFAEKDQRVRVIHKSNGGLSDARNVGIGALESTLFTCIDGDDYVSADYIADLLAPFLAGPCDLSSVRFLKVPPAEGKIERKRPIQPEWITLDTSEALERLFLQQGLTTSAWGKMYKTEYFSGLEYPVGSIHEDLPVTYKAVSRATTVCLVDSCSYYYVQHDGSITASANYKKRLEALDFVKDAIDDVKNLNESVINAAKTRAFMEAAYIISQVPARRELKSIENRVTPVIEANRWAVIQSRAPKEQKFLALLSYIGLEAIRKAFLLKARLGSFR